MPVVNIDQVHKMLDKATSGKFADEAIHDDGGLQIDSEVGFKKHYEPSGFLKKGEAAMAELIGQACEDLRSTGRFLLA